MKKITAIFGFVLATAIAVSSQAEVTFKNVPFAEALKLAKKEKKIIMVDYFTTWCGWCKVLDRKTYANAAVGDYANTNMISLKIDAEKGEGIELARRSAIQGFPTIIFYDADGKELHRVVGFVDAIPFLDRMKAAVTANAASAASPTQSAND